MHIVGRRIAGFLGLKFEGGPRDASPDPREAEASLAELLASIPEVSR